MKQTTGNPTRTLCLERLRNQPRTKILIIGGGIHGAAIARLAALNGIDCILAEQGDYACGTSSRSTKLAHGGLRYLENFDFEQVFEGIKAREELFEEAYPMVKPVKFLIPIKKGDWWSRLKLGIGLYLYDLMVTNKDRKHRFIPRFKLTFKGFHKDREDLMGCYQYTDGILNDARLVIEHIVDANSKGSCCVNYLKVEKVERTDEGWKVTAKDKFSDLSYEIFSEVVINCAGPWIPFIGHPPSCKLSKELRYSAGVHLLFDKPWNDPAHFLPMPGRSRYYFVLPHPAGTMVGTTEREVTDVPFEQYPLKEEIEEVLARLEKDLPYAGLDRSSLHYAFAGVRTLPLRDKGTGVARLSRKHIWRWQEGVLTLLGGKYTTASWTAFEGFEQAAKALQHSTPLKSLSGLPYPGFGTENELQEILCALKSKGVNENTALRIVNRLGVRARYLLENDQRLQPISPNLLRGEVELAINEEQAMTVEDILRRRTEVEYLRGNGMEEISEVSNHLSLSRDSSQIKSEAKEYAERICHIHSLLY